MTKLIAETAWHHEGDFSFMKNLVKRICENSNADIVKFHISLDLDEYMSKDHEAYNTLKRWMLRDLDWEELIGIVRQNNKELMLLLNDTKAINFAKQFNPEYIELHSVSLNVPRLQNAVLNNFSEATKIVIGVGGCTVMEVKEAVNFFKNRDTVLMFGFQNYPTKYEDINLHKIKKIQNLFQNKFYGYADHTAWNHTNNELITLLVASNEMSFIEKHVTTEYGQERCDYSSAISIDQFSELSKKIKILDRLYGDGSMDLNLAEQKYSSYGPMKMAAITSKDLRKGEKLTKSDFNFCRTSQNSNLSQIEILNAIGSKLSENIQAGQVICLKHVTNN
jgi:N,N'-diacetyllegionaminate synthase